MRITESVRAIGTVGYKTSSLQTENEIGNNTDRPVSERGRANRKLNSKFYLPDFDDVQLV